MTKIFYYGSIIRSQFNYNPVVETFCLRQSNNSINKSLEKVVRIINDQESNFQDLFSKIKNIPFIKETCNAYD